MDEIERKLTQDSYKFAIEARDKLNDNYHKWMTFYYVANAAVLVAMGVFKDDIRSLLILSFLGLFVSTLWNLSCKGYYYWSNSWIEIIIKLEKINLQGNSDLGVYSVFSKKVADKKRTLLNPIDSANISTPKLTLLFSLFSIIIWLCTSAYIFSVKSQYKHDCELIIVVLFAILYIMLYSIVIPKYTLSRKDGYHDLI